MEFFSVAVPLVTYDLLENFDTYNDFIELLTRSVKIQDSTEEEPEEDPEDDDG